MKRKNLLLKRITSIALCAALALSTAGFAGTTNAAAKTSSTGKISITVNQDYKMAQQILKYVNKYRKKNHRKPLTMDKSLTDAAITRGAELMIYVPQSSPHRRPNGKLSKSLNSKICYENCQEIGGYYYLDPSDYADAKTVVDQWIDSAPHRKGLLLPNAKSVGISATYTTTDAGYVNAITFSMELSNSKAKKVEKSKSVKKYTKNVVTQTKYLKKKYFSFTSYFDYLDKYNPTMQLYPRYDSPYMHGRPTINPSSFTWSSSNKSIATVNKNGVVKRGKKTGKVKITAKLKTGNKVSFSKTLKVK